MEVASLLTSARVAFDIAKGITALKSEVERNQAVSKILEVLIAVQSDALAMQEKYSLLTAKVVELEKECVRLKDWNRDKERYELKEIARGVFARIEQGFVGDFQSANKFCASCFEQNAKSPLQQEKVEVGRRLRLVCHHCESSIIFDSYLKNS